MKHDQQGYLIDDETQRLIFESRKMVAQSFEMVRQAEELLRIVQQTQQITTDPDTEIEPGE